MSEYWKSTPKYWCKYCKTYVRDTKLEKQNHEATPKHQGNLKRFLRDLHRDHEKDEKDKERAKTEVARLNGLVTGSGNPLSSASSFGRGPTPSIPKPQATAAQRKQQAAQLAELGVSIPDEFRPEMAMAGEWQVTSQKIIEPEGEKGPDAIALGVRKRIAEEEEEEATETKKRRWGSAYRTHPEAEENGDLDALLGSVIRKGPGLLMKTETGKEADPGTKEEIKREIDTTIGTKIKLEPEIDQSIGNEGAPALGAIKTEPSDGTPKPETALPLSNEPVKVEAESETQVAAGVVFKKRKPKNIRQK